MSDTFGAIWSDLPSQSCINYIIFLKCFIIKNNLILYYFLDLNSILFDYLILQKQSLICSFSCYVIYNVDACQRTGELATGPIFFHQKAVN